MREIELWSKEFLMAVVEQTLTVMQEEFEKELKRQGF